MVVQQFIIICHSLQVLQVYFLLLNLLYLFRKSLNIIISFYLKHTNHLPVKPGAAIMLASHYPEVDTRWSYECGILNFARNSSRTLISAKQQQKSLRCLPKATRLHSNTTRRFQEGITKVTRCDFKYDIYTKAMRRSHNTIRLLHGFVL